MRFLNFGSQSCGKKEMPWPRIELGTSRSSVWRSPNWAIAALSFLKLLNCEQTGIKRQQKKIFGYFFLARAFCGNSKSHICISWNLAELFHQFSSGVTQNCSWTQTVYYDDGSAICQTRRPRQLKTSRMMGRRHPTIAKCHCLKTTEAAVKLLHILTLMTVCPSG